jgi:hypothetical protein
VSPLTATPRQVQLFALNPRPPLRALAVGSVAAVVGALLVVLGSAQQRGATPLEPPGQARALHLPLVLTVIGIALLILAMSLVVAALVLTARLRTALTLDAEAIRVTRGRRTRAVAWSGIESVSLRGPRLTFTSKGGGSAVVVVNPRSPGNPTFLALVAAIRERLNADRGYRPGF